MDDLRMTARGWIQWKGTNVCIDIHCNCGKSSHYDGDFMYFIECPFCGRRYQCLPDITLIETNYKGKMDKAEK